MFGSLNKQNYTILTSHQENSLEATRRIMVKLHRLKRSVSIETQATFLILGNISQLKCHPQKQEQVYITNKHLIILLDCKSISIL